MTQTADLSIPFRFAKDAIRKRREGISAQRKAQTASASDSAADAPSIDIDGFRRGDQHCCRRVLDKFSPLIWSVVVSYVREPAARDDVYQEICVRIWERSGQYSGRGSLGGWINRISHRWCHNWCRSQRARESSRQRYVLDTLALAGSAEPSEDPAQLADREEFKHRLTAALAVLPKKQSDTFILVRVKGRTTKEAAGILGVRPATVRSNLRHATRKLRKELKDYEYGLS